MLVGALVKRRLNRAHLIIGVVLLDCQMSVWGQAMSGYYEMADEMPR